MEYRDVGKAPGVISLDERARRMSEVLRLRAELARVREEARVLNREKSMLAADYCALSVAKAQDHAQFSAVLKGLEVPDPHRSDILEAMAEGRSPKDVARMSHEDLRREFARYGLRLEGVKLGDPHVAQKTRRRLRSLRHASQQQQNDATALALNRQSRAVKRCPAN
jgi:hypothetical protein